MTVKALSLLIVAVVVAGLAGPAAAHEHGHGPIKIDHPFARATAPTAKNGAAFMKLMNNGATDRLVSAAADVSEVVELHTHIKEGDIMRIRKVDAIEVVGGGMTELKPGGLHVMLIGLKAPLVEGARFPLTLTFEKAGTVTVEVEVKGAGAGGHGGHM